MAAPRTGGRLAADVTSRIRALAETRTDAPIVVSVYLSLDPSEFPTPRNRMSQIESLIDEARNRVADAEYSHDDRRTVSEDIQRVREWAEHSLEAAGAQGVAIFCCSPVALFDVYRLSRAMGPAVFIEHSPHLEPLAAALPTDSWCIFLVNRRTARVLRGSTDRLFEVTSLEDDVHGRHDQGGWSQARYQRSVEKDVLDHVQHSCDVLFDIFQQLPFDKLLVGCSQELWPEVEAKLHPYLGDRVVERIDAEVEHEGPDDVLARAQPSMEKAERRNEAQLLDRLAEQLGRNDRAVAGMKQVLEALDMSRVEVLLIDPNAQIAGLDAAVQNAILQAASVHHVRYAEPQRALGGPIAALLRF